MPTQLPAPGAPNVLFLVDLSGYVFRAYHAVPPLSNAAGLPTNAIYGVTAMLQKLVKEQKPSHLAVALDSKGPSFRKEMYDGYKANRPPAPPDLSIQIERLRDVIDAYAIPSFVESGIEADDLIASVVKRARAEGFFVVVVSADKDLLQLVEEGGVVMYDSMRGKVFGREETREKMGVYPEKVRDLLALMGDTSDNVPGVKSVGPKTAVQLLEAHGDLDGIYANLEGIKKKGLHDALTTHKDAAFLSQKLVTLKHDVAVDFDIEKLVYGGASDESLRRLFSEFEFTRLLAELGDAPASAQTAASVSAFAVRTIREAGELSALIADAREKSRFSVHFIVDGDDRLPQPILGVALATDAGEGAYVPLVRHELGEAEPLSQDVVASLLGPVLADASIAKLCADAKRELLIARNLGVEMRGVTMDTMLASYLIDADKRGHDIAALSQSEMLGVLPDPFPAGAKGKAREVPISTLPTERVAAYAAAVAQGVFVLSARFEKTLEKLGASSLLSDLELPIARVCADIEALGIRLDVEKLAGQAKHVDEELKLIEVKCRDIVGHDLSLSAPRQLEVVLFDELGLRVIKRTKTARSTDHEVLEELALEHPLPAAILEYRMLAKLKSTYFEALPLEVAPDGRIHTRFNQAVAATGRLSSSDPNLQNIPIRTTLGRAIRDAFVPRDGWQMLAADYSQIELRVLAHLSHDPELVEAFRANDDVHVRTATALFGVEKGAVTKDMRGRAKTVNFAVIYGQTEFALARNLKIDRKEAGRYIAAFFERYAGVAKYMRDVVDSSRASGGVVHTLFGRRRVVPDLSSSNFNLRSAAERVVRNTPIQGTSADILKKAMLSVDDAIKSEGLAGRMLLTVHDELVFETPPDQVDALERLVRERMESVVTLDVPLIVEAGRGDSWGTAH
jgi:DNA polymerase-1